MSLTWPKAGITNQWEPEGVALLVAVALPPTPRSMRLKRRNDCRDGFDWDERPRLPHRGLGDPRSAFASRAAAASRTAINSTTRALDIQYPGRVAS